MPTRTSSRPVSTTSVASAAGATTGTATGGHGSPTGTRHRCRGSCRAARHWRSRRGTARWRRASGSTPTRRTASTRRRERAGRARRSRRRGSPGDRSALCVSVHDRHGRACWHRRHEANRPTVGADVVGLRCRRGSAGNLVARPHRPGRRHRCRCGRGAVPAGARRRRRRASACGRPTSRSASMPSPAPTSGSPRSSTSRAAKSRWTTCWRRPASPSTTAPTRSTSSCRIAPGCAATRKRLPPCSSGVRDLVNERVDHSAGPGLVKVIIESGELPDQAAIDRATHFAISLGADFVKTSTGKTPVSATPEAAEIILEAIELSGLPVGLKASGGIRTVGDARVYLELAEQIMGEGWISPDTFRFGASAVLDDLVAAAGDGLAPDLARQCPGRARPMPYIRCGWSGERATATTIDWDALDAVLFDLDGVLTPTAEIHERAWKSMFDAFLAARARRSDRGSRSAPTTTSPTSTGSGASTACARSSHHAASSCPREPSTTSPDTAR